MFFNAEFLLFEDKIEGSVLFCKSVFSRRVIFPFLFERIVISFDSVFIRQFLKVIPAFSSINVSSSSEEK